MTDAELDLKRILLDNFCIFLGRNENSGMPEHSFFLEFLAGILQIFSAFQVFLYFDRKFGIGCARCECCRMWIF